MRNIKYLITIMLSAFVLHSCSNDDQEQIDAGGIDGSAAIEFLSVVEGDYNPMARAIGSSWTADDRIGIFMKKEGQDLSAANIVAEATNVEHVTVTNYGIFTAVNAIENIYFPKDGSKVDFIAYYPFQAEMADYKYKVDVADQSDQEAIDLLFSNNVKATGKDNPQTLLQFKHMLSRITFDLQKGEGVTSLLGLKISIAGQPTLADFDLAKGTLAIDNQSVDVIDARTYNDGAKGEAIVLPVGKKDVEVTFTLGTSSFTHKFKDVDLTAGKKNEYTVTINNKGGSVTPTPEYAMWRETPLFTPQEGLQYVNYMVPKNSDAGIWGGHRNYSALYDTENRVALWVAYPLHTNHMKKGLERPRYWTYSPLIEEKYQPNVLRKSWPASPPYDRGHQIASSDRSANKTLNDMTFHVTNATLQVIQFNGGTWNDLEKRVQALSTDTIFVVSGVMIKTKDDQNIQYEYDNSNRPCAIPKYFYKALAKEVGGKFYTIGYKLPNKLPEQGKDFEAYRMTVAELEKETGYTYFPSIDPAAKETIGSIF